MDTKTFTVTIPNPIESVKNSALQAQLKIGSFGSKIERKIKAVKEALATE